VESFLETVTDERRRRDCRTVMQIMKKVTGSAPKMWGPSIVGFGSYRYKYESGREGDWFLTGFSPRKQNLTLYVMSGFKGQDPLMARLGKHKTGKACLYINRLEDIDLGVLTKLIERSVRQLDGSRA
jgi:hypothetical protein